MTIGYRRGPVLIALAALLTMFALLAFAAPARVSAAPPAKLAAQSALAQTGPIDVQAGVQAEIERKLNLTFGTEAPAADRGAGAILADLLIALVMSAVFVVAGSVVILAWPRRVQMASALISSTPWPAIIVGVLTGLLLPPVLGVVCVVLAITVIGLVLIPVVLLAALALWVYGSVTVGLWMGQRVAESGRVPAASRSLLVTALVGLGLFVAVTFIPTALIPPLGWFVTYMLGFIGVGAAILSRFGATAPFQSVSRMLGQQAGRATRRLQGHPPDPQGMGDETRRVS